MKQCKVRCPTDGDVTVKADTMVIDDFEDVYRFTCPTCGSSVDKRLDERIRELLRGCGVITIDEACWAFESLLSDDRNIERWLLSA